MKVLDRRGQIREEGEGETPESKEKSRICSSSSDMLLWVSKLLALHCEGTAAAAWLSHSQGPIILMPGRRCSTWGLIQRKRKRERETNRVWQR